MEGQEDAKSEIEKAGETLFSFAVDREDVKALTARLPSEANVNRNTMEYELQILKIISVGWGISYFLAEWPQKQPLLECYWRAVQDFSRQLSSTTGLLIGQDIDYFEILRKRLDAYLASMGDPSQPREPVAAIGPVFAEHCGNREDAFTVLTGSKLFAATIGQVRRYLESLVAKYS